LGTVYRNLGQMAGEGTVVRLTFGDSPDCFDPNTHEHFHVVCSQCGRVFDTDESVPSALLQKLDAAVEGCTGVKVEGRALLFNGVCEECR
jgi:Fe2+ or Zn2+ uptake regulation protein